MPADTGAAPAPKGSARLTKNQKRRVKKKEKQGKAEAKDADTDTGVEEPQEASGRVVVAWHLPRLFGPDGSVCCCASLLQIAHSVLII